MRFPFVYPSAECGWCNGWHVFVTLLLANLRTTDSSTVMLSTPIAFGCFGLSSWLLISGIYAIVASYADVLPEGYDISFYLICAQCLSNIVPAILQMWLELKDLKAIKSLIWANLLTGLAVCCLLAQVYPKSSLLQTPLYITLHQNSSFLAVLEQHNL